jgi:hypothetical protein
MDESERAEDEGCRSRELRVGTRGDVRGKDKERVLQQVSGAAPTPVLASNLDPHEGELRLTKLRTTELSCNK